MHEHFLHFLVKQENRKLKAHLNHWMACLPGRSQEILICRVPVCPWHRVSGSISQYNIRTLPAWHLGQKSHHVQTLTINFFAQYTMGNPYDFDSTHVICLITHHFSGCLSQDHIYDTCVSRSRSICYAYIYICTPLSCLILLFASRLRKKRNL